MYLLKLNLTLKQTVILQGMIQSVYINIYLLKLNLTLKQTVILHGMT